MAFHRPTLFLCCAVLAAAPDVGAVGFGQVSPSAVLGQPLNVQVPIHLDGGERMFAECVKAEITAGDTVLLPSQIRVSVQPTPDPSQWLARIGTVGPVTEPIVEFSVSAGCEKRFMRRFTVFADPPVMALTASAVAPALGLAAPVAVARPVAPPSADASLAETPVPVRQPRRAFAHAAARTPRHAMPRAAPRQAERAVVPGDQHVAVLLLDVAGPRLRMDLDDPVIMPSDAASAAARADSDAADGDAVDAHRLQMLEKSLAALTREAQATQASESGLRTRLAAAEARSRMLPWLLGLLLLAAGVAAWLALRLRSVGQGGDKKSSAAPVWWSGEAASEAAGLPPADAAMPPPRPDAELARTLRAAPSAARLAEVVEDDDLAASERTETLPGPPPELPDRGAFGSIVDGTAAPARAVSVEELLDLEQQADFFIALGQEDAAVDLLMSHLRGTRGQSPLPYTKLLEIYRRQGDRSAYERIRARFNRSFNAYAPDWETGPLHGRSLEDYPDVVADLQAQWSSPLNSMAVLEAMLFRNDERQALFDLPAYKDVLLLYSLARDLYQQEGLSAADVDLLLPLDDAAASQDHAALGDAAAPGAGEVGKASYELTSFSLDLPTPPHDPKR